MKRHRTLWALQSKDDGEIYHATVWKPKKDGIWWRCSEWNFVIGSVSVLRLVRIKATVNR